MTLVDLVIFLPNPSSRVPTCAWQSVSAEADRQAGQTLAGIGLGLGSRRPKESKLPDGRVAGQATRRDHVLPVGSG